MRAPSLIKPERLVLWDIDGTLLHCGSDGKKALNQAFLELFDVDNAFETAAIGGAMDGALIDAIFRAHGIHEAEIDSFVDHYRGVLVKILEANAEKQILPGVEPLLQALHQDSRIINALLTSNLAVGAHAKLDAFQLRSYFELGAYGDELGDKWDAAHRCIEMAQQQFGTIFPLRNIFLIGDSCYDIMTAKECGITSIAVATGWADAPSLKACEPDYFFDNLAEFHQIQSILLP